MEFMKSPPGDDPLVVEGYFAASPMRVFKSWTDPTLVMKWFGQTPNSLYSATIDLKIGGIWRFLKSKDAHKSIGFEGEYEEIKTGEKLVFTWAHVIAHASGSREMTPYSKVEVSFTPKGSGTCVRLVHSAISTDMARKGIGGGWMAAFTHLTALFGAQK